MKKQIILFACFFLFTFTMYGKTWYGTGSDTPAPIQQTLIQSTEQSIIVKFNVDGFFLLPVETPRGTEYIVTVPDMVQISEQSTPDLPWYAISAIIPDQDLMRSRILNYSYTDFEGIDVAPSKGHILRSEDPTRVPFVYGDVYNQDAFYPELRDQLQDAYIWRDFRGQDLNVMPFSYNPVTKTLRVYTELTIEIYSDGTGGANQYDRRSELTHMEREFRSIYQHHFINFDHPNRYQILDEEGNMLVISHGPYMAAMEPFLEWKRTIGREIEMVDIATIGVNSTAIRNFVASYYNQHGLTHLLLVGDHQHVPSHSVSAGFSDSYYGFILGNDSYSEVFVGRFSAESVADVATQVERTIHYERDINESDTWLNVGIGIARNEGAGSGHYGESDAEHMDFIRDSLLNYTYVTVYREYDGNVPGVPNTNAAQMTQRFNSGASITNFCNHGSMTSWSVGGYNISHVNALTNVNKLPYIWSVACDNGRFTQGFCFAEAWMRATHNGQPTGAIATMMSWMSQPWQPPMTGQDEMVTILVEKRDHIKRTMAGVSINGSARMISMHGSSGINTHETWILFGDPSLMLRTDIPTPIVASHLPTVFLGSSEFTVSADADDAIVSLTMNGEILGTAYIQDGTATVEFPVLTEPGIMTVAILGWNRVTYLQDLEVVPATGPYIIYSSSMIDDELGGNNDGQIDYGETIVLGVELKNIGIHTASNSLVTLTSTSPYVNITNGSHNYGNIQPDELKMIEDAFTFEVSDDVPDNTTLPFHLEIASTEDTWTAAFNRVAYAPEFAVGNMLISDPLGNNNGQADPGETVDLLIANTNTGHSAAFDVDAVISINSPYVTVNISYYSFASLTAGQTSNAVFSITIDEDAPIGTPVPVFYTVTSGAYSAQKQFTIQVGMIFENFESGDFTLFDWVHGGTQPWTITNAGAWEGEYAAKSGTISHNQSSAMMLEYDVAVHDSISFYRRVSSEANDQLRFSINGQVVGQWGGIVPWGRVTFPVTPGVKTFKWEYVKNATITGGEDCAWVDFIVFPIQSACAAPKNLSASSVTAFTAQLNWVPGGNEMQWDVLWGAKGFNPNSGGNLIEDISAVPFLLTGLESVTEYDFYVRGHCDEQLSSVWNGPASFTTLCDIFTLPYWEPFGTPALTCWAFPEGQGNWAFGNSYTPPSSTSGAPNAFFSWSPTQTNYSYSFTSPLFDGTGMLEVMLDYILFINSFSASTVENMAVEFKTLDATQWTLLELFTTAGLGSGNAQYIRTNQVLNGMAGNMFQVRFRAHGPNSWNINGWGLDDIHVHGEEGSNLPGDSNCDGVVNVLDAITTVNYVMGSNPEPFCWDNAELTGDGVINVLDIIATVNIIMGGKTSSPFEINSAAAHIYLNRDGIQLESDGTLAGLQFELNGLDAANLNLLLSGYEFVTTERGNTLMGLIFSFDNTPIPAGKIDLFSFGNQEQSVEWGAVVAGNLNAEEVPVFKHVAGIRSDLAGEFNITAYPNPSAGVTNISVETPLRSTVELKVFDMHGREVMQINENIVEKGTRNFVINEGKLLSKGVYTLQIIAIPVDFPGDAYHTNIKLVIN